MEAEPVSIVPSRDELQKRANAAAQALAMAGKQINVDLFVLIYRMEALERILRDSGIDLSRLDYLTDLCKTEDLEDRVRETSPKLIVPVTARPA